MKPQRTIIIGITEPHREQPSFTSDEMEFMCQGVEPEPEPDPDSDLDLDLDLTFSLFFEEINRT